VQVRATAVLALLLGVLGVVLGTPSAASAAPPTTSQATSWVHTSSEEEGATISGALIDESNANDPQPVEGVEVTVLDDAGNEVGTATSNADGQFSITVPESSGTYTVQVDPDTLPEGKFLRDPGDVENTVTLTGFDVTVQFPIGPDTRQTTGLLNDIADRLTTGILFGLILALSALGLSMIFGTTGLTNFAHGELVTFGAVVAVLINQQGVHIIPAAAITIVIGAFFGWAQDSFLWRKLRRRGTGLIAMMIVSIGMALFLRAMYQYIIGGTRVPFEQYVTAEPFEIGVLTLPPRDMVIGAVALVVLLAASFALVRTKIGKAMRAVADNPALAASSGINVDRVLSVVWIGGTALAALGGVLYTLIYQMDYQMGLRLLLLLFAAVILGGIGTIWGAMLGALIVSIFTELSTLVLPAELKYTSALFVMILILLFRPQGLLNRAQRVG
jgi:neutral amino acid transport system permease protein